MPSKNKFLALVLPLLILAAGAGAMVFLIKNRPAPQKQARADQGALVRLLTVNKTSIAVNVHSTGTVQPVEQIAVIPQVSGRITALASQCVAGGFLAKGDKLFTIEATDYRLAVEQARATLAKAEADLATTRGNAEVARLEWQRFGGASGEAVNPLVLHEPQLNTARANLAAAQAALAQAELNLARTEVRTPFNCMVVNESLDAGQYVRSGTAVATLAGTDAAEIIVPLPLAELAWCTVPRAGKGTAAPATVRTTVGDRHFQWQGRVVRSLGEVDPKGRMIRLAVRVADPYRLRTDSGPAGLDLAMGMFVEVDIHGRTAHEVVALPRRALRTPTTVWLMDAERKLRLREVHVIRLTDEEALVDQGLAQGEQVVLTALSGAADGMLLRPANPGERQ